MSLMQEELDMSVAFINKLEETDLIRRASKRTAKQLGRLLDGLRDQQGLRLKAARPWEQQKKAANAFAMVMGDKKVKGKSHRWVSLQTKMRKWVKSVMELRHSGELKTHDEMERAEEERVRKEAESAAAARAVIMAEIDEKRDGWKRVLGDVGICFYDNPSDVRR